MPPIYRQLEATYERMRANPDDYSVVESEAVNVALTRLETKYA